jgi:hypothetical protein
MNPIVFAPSAIWPLAIGFFGLGTGYLIWGGSALFRWPERSPDVDRAIGAWGIAMNGFMQFITGVYLMVGLTWFGVFANARPLYMAALAFTAYGVHWFVLGYRRMTAASSQPEAWMAIGFLLLSFLGVLVFFTAGDIPVGILFIGLTLIYASEVPSNFGVLPNGERIVGFWQFVTGIWLMYLTYAAVFNFSLGLHWLL